MSRHRNKAVIVAAISIASLAISADVRADNVYWQGGTGALSDPNYFDFTTTTPNHAPVAGDILYFGADGTAASAVSLSVGKLYVGHSDTGGGASAPPGGGTVNVTAGTLATTAGASNSVNSAIIVGYNNNGTLNIDGAGIVTSNRLAVVGFGNNIAQSAILNITNGGTLTISAGNLNIGDTSITGGVGMPGQVNVNGTLSVNSTLQVGVQADSSYTQTGGAATVAGTVVGLSNADGSTFTLSGGTFNGTTFTLATGTAAQGSSDNISASVTGGTLTLSGALNVGNATSSSTNTSLSFTGGTVNIAGAALVGVNGSTTSNASLLIGGNANVKFTGNFVLADNTSNATNTSLTITDNAHLTATGVNGVFIGRGTSANTTVTQSGGTFDITNRYLLAPGTNATGVVVNHSAGTTNVGLDVRVGDTGGTATYNLSGTAILNSTQGLFVGHQNSTAFFNQTGGTLTISGGTLRIGDVDQTGSTAYSTGTYNLSGGTVTAAPAAGTTLTYTMTVGAAGTGTMRMIGDDGSLSVTGNILIHTVAPCVGTLAFQLQAGDASISPINATGFVTLDPASVLQLDFNSNTPTQGVYTVLNAASIVNSGLVPSIPAGWNFSITSGGNGQLLKFFAGDLNGDGRINADDYALIDRGAAKHLTDGADGDLNADGTINSQDYLLMDSAYAQLGGSLTPTFLAARESEFGSGYVSTLLASVPEPTSLFAACGLALPLLRRRKH